LVRVQQSMFSKRIGQIGKIPSRFAVCLSLILASYFANAQPDLIKNPQLDGTPAIHDSITNQLSRFISLNSAAWAEKGYRIEHNIGTNHPHLKDKTCESPINFEFTRNPLTQSNTTIELACEDQTPWRLFIAAEINLYAPVAVTATPISRGTRISGEEISFEERKVNQYRYATYSRIEDLIGLVAKRTIRAGRAISPNLLEPPRVIDRGDEVLIIATNDKLSIKMKGEALNHGLLGQQISVKNLQSQRVIRAVVAGQGRVEVQL
jgi:flagella basal body P-ring formation protein FlgA